MPKTLAGVFDSFRDVASFAQDLGAFLDFFDVLDAADRFSAISRPPKSTESKRMSALAGAIAEYLAKQNKLGAIPKWAAGPSRRLDQPWHVSSLFIDWEREFLTPGMKEYFTFSSPAEFASRNIFTEERPLRRARSELSHESSTPK